MVKISAIKKILLPLFAAALLCSCNSFDKLLKNPDFGMKYREAGKFYERAKYDKAVMLYENIMTFYRNTPQEDTINIRVARGYYQQSDYEMAQHYYGQFRQRFPRSKFIEEVDYMQGLCSFDLSLRPSLDQTETNNAIQAFNMYLYRYPKGEFAGECKEKIAELEGRLVEKAFNGAKLYYTTEHYKAAVVALKSCIKSFPSSPYREEMLYLVLRSSYLHAKNSVREKQRERYQLAVDEYYNLVSEYPETKHKREAEKIYKELQEKTKS
ncbi:MAG: outer membrane protein assembly factor BamD [Prevotellaceae bacterium]|jgi:outer membrane protein assembly factor BamD|nr:outer membrane protein assembly factor BamD [Prevotellaceae bacterium]